MADRQRPAAGVHRRLAPRADDRLRADSGRIAQRDGDKRFVHCKVQLSTANLTEHASVERKRYVARNGAGAIDSPTVWRGVFILSVADRWTKWRNSVFNGRIGRRLELVRQAADRSRVARATHSNAASCRLPYPTMFRS